MKLLIDTSKEQIILDSGESYSIDELNEFLKAHLLDHYKIYGPNPILGTIRPEFQEEFVERWKKIMDEDRGAFKWRPVKEINGYPSIIPMTPDELKPPFHIGDTPINSPHWQDPHFMTQGKESTGDPFMNIPPSTCKTTAGGPIFDIEKIEAFYQATQESMRRINQDKESDKQD